MRFEELAGRRVVIWGAGREGRAAYAELQRRGVPARFALPDDAEPPVDLADVATCGPAAFELMTAADVVIKSPGVPRTAPQFAGLLAAGVVITSLTDLWLSANAERVVAVTGTKGKSTTSSLIQHLLQSMGIGACLVGNGGTPVTDGDHGSEEVAVTEVSSYQAADLSCSPRLAVVTSLYPEHLPWHGGYEQYLHDKLNLVAHGPRIVVVPSAAGEIADLVRARITDETRLVDPAELGIALSAAGLSWTGVGELAAERLPVRGQHNFANAALAITAVAVGFPGLDPARLLASVATFAPLTYRLETIPSGDGRRWVDDSLATAPEAVVAALETFPEVPVTLILGGSDRGLAFDSLVDYLPTRAPEAPVRIIAVGPAGARWLGGGRADTRLARDFAEAMSWASAPEPDAQVVLLSPGAPSFDEFANYEERSAAFRRAAAQTIADQTIASQTIAGQERVGSASSGPDAR